MPDQAEQLAPEIKKTRWLADLPGNVGWADVVHQVDHWKAAMTSVLEARQVDSAEWRSDREDVFDRLHTLFAEASEQDWNPLTDVSMSDV